MLFTTRSCDFLKVNVPVLECKETEKGSGMKSSGINIEHYCTCTCMYWYKKYLEE